VAEMPDILEKICRAKRDEIRRLKAGPADELTGRARNQRPPRGFRAALLEAPEVALIAEVKRASPSAGVIRPDFDPVAIARTYAESGAAAVSVLTDRPFFQGGPEHLEMVRREVPLPLLRKDFVLDEIQVIEARALGADAYLLIVAALDAHCLGRLVAAGRELGMDALVEIHDEAELRAALEAGADLIGINNRNLHTFEVDLAVSERLAPRARREAGRPVAVVAESGIRLRADVERLKACGVDAVLVGETLMRAPDLAAATRALVGL